MDLKKFDVVAGSNEGFAIQLVRPDNAEKLPLFIQVLGADSAEYKKVDGALARKRIDKLWQGGKFRPSSQSADEADADNIARLTAVTKDWWEVLEDGSLRHSFEVGGEKYSCTPSMAEQLYSNYPWIKEQVWIGVNDRANFIKG